ncbi:wax ester/triacylglycerol synthase family O-acyltransferase [Nocardia noduli]|uniref:wax ester/triacylglycerol synthase family O-acyltransferase n=1 Tax=Nocardia noduli TaxID=2815722 RepID=UPI001C234808|nr:wax ester/triacylglycerol synthase family O-acyltransferase [Nocardia noduli]
MRVNRVAAQDATMFWLSARTRNDLFLLFSFADEGVPTSVLRALVETRSAEIADLRVRLRAVRGDLDYPAWVPCDFRDDQFVEHHLPRPDWPHLLDAVGELLDTSVDAAVRPWRVHVFRVVEGAPAPGVESEPATVVLLQMSHALVDGRRASAVARALFASPGVGAEAVMAESDSDADSSRDSVFGQARALGNRAVGFLRGVGSSEPVDAVVGLIATPVHVAQTVTRGVRAYRAQRELARLTAAGAVPAPPSGFTPTPLNRSAAEGISRHAVRVIVTDGDDMRLTGRTVTVLALTAVSVALTEYLSLRGESMDRLGAQVPMAMPAGAHVRNNYRGLGVDLHVDEPDLSHRADRIADELAERRIRAGHPLLGAQERVTAVTPARVLRRDTESYPLDTPDSIAGHTVVSSVHRGAADLHFGGPVRFTGGFPAIGSVMHLTHGIHGLGDTVTISVHADAAVLPDIDVYTELLRVALNRVSAIEPR